jgi:hypothetical protein
MVGLRRDWLHHLTRQSRPRLFQHGSKQEAGRHCDARYAALRRGHTGAYRRSGVAGNAVARRSRGYSGVVYFGPAKLERQ